MIILMLPHPRNKGKLDYPKFSVFSLIRSTYQCKGCQSTYKGKFRLVLSITQFNLG